MKAKRKDAEDDWRYRPNVADPIKFRRYGALNI